MRFRGQGPAIQPGLVVLTAIIFASDDLQWDARLFRGTGLWRRQFLASLATEGRISYTIMRKAIIIATVICSILQGCTTECDRIDGGAIKDNIYFNSYLELALPLPPPYSEVSQGEIDRLTASGLSAIGDQGGNKGCPQVLLCLKKEMGEDVAQLLIISEPISTYPRDFDIIGYFKDTYRQAADQNGLSYSDYDTVSVMSGREFRILDVEFVGKDKAFMRIYQTTVNEVFLLISVSGDYEAGIIEWIQAIEKLKFSKNGPAA